MSEDPVTRGYEVRVHHGRALPELRRIVAASDAAAAERAEQLLVELPDAIGIEVMRAGERLHVRGVVPAATAPLGHARRLDPDQRDRLWALMQRIERARHRAELAEARAARGSAALRAEMTAIAQEWRDLAQHIEAEDTASHVAAARAGAASAPSPAVVSAASSGRAGGWGRWSGLVVGMAIGALGALTLATPRWIEASTGVDLDRGSGALEWAIAVLLPLAAIAAALAMRAAPRRLPTKLDPPRP